MCILYFESYVHFIIQTACTLLKCMYIPFCFVSRISYYFFILNCFASCHIISHYIISYFIISYHIISYHILSYYIILYHIISCHIISYHILSYHIISYNIMSYYIISYFINLQYYFISQSSFLGECFMLYVRIDSEQSRPSDTTHLRM